MSDSNGQSTGKRTLVDEGTEFKGALSSSCPIVVMGKVEGEVTGPAMEVAESGVVSGRIKVTELRCRGEMAGDLEAETVQMSGRIRDQTVIRARSLEVAVPAAGQASRFGDCELVIGDAPDKQAAIDEASGVSKRGAGIPVAEAVAPAVAAAAAAEPAPAAEAASGSDRRKRRNTGSVRVPPEGAVEKSPA
jgi:cytoskeletal protein CcmA (bactofilin family)